MGLNSYIWTYTYVYNSIDLMLCILYLYNIVSVTNTLRVWGVFVLNSKKTIKVIKHILREKMWGTILKSFKYFSR